MVLRDHRFEVIRAVRHRAGAGASASALISCGAPAVPSAASDGNGERRPEFHRQAADNHPLVIVRLNALFTGGQLLPVRAEPESPSSPRSVENLDASRAPRAR